MKVLKYWETKQPISWVRIHALPNHVYFSHKRHVLGGIACQSCHGDVQLVDRVSQQAPLTMGWCLQCHEQRGAPRECETCHK
ncbi:MAG: cytochrome c3 family protein [Acidobacteria bacterium]|nr:cytochrome c3 family protein [Acidobacteriota bacterium]